MCDRIIEKDYGSYLKSLIESSSYDGLKKLEIAGRYLHDTPSLSSILQHCGLLAPHTKLTRVDIVETAFTPLSRHLPSVEILEFNNCRFKPTSLADEEDIITNFNINVVDTDVGELTMSGTEEQSHTDYFDKMIQEHLLIVIQTENLPRTKYYINVPESTQADEAIDTTTVN